MKPSHSTFFTGACAIALALAAAQSAQAAAIIFDDFNVNEGHFNQAPSFSGTSTGTASSSTADRDTTGAPREGVGQERVVLDYNGTGASFRCRFLSGAGTVANNVAFTTTPETDGKIGFYLKTTATGWETSINLDGPAGSIADMDGSTSVPIIADGEWHLYEWDLDSLTDWGAVPGIGGGHGGALLDGTHTIDSIWLRDLDGTLGPSATIYLDFVALNPSGSVGDLLSDPCINTSGVLVNGPLSTNANQVLVTGVFDTATALTVYQDSGSGMTPIGTTTTGIVAGNNYVSVSGLVKGAKVAATQTVNGQESCVPTAGVLVGGGANPPVRIALTIREMTNSIATVGEPGAITGQTALHFLGATEVSGGAPIDAPLVYPSNEWQTVTFSRDSDSVGNVVNVAGTPTTVPAGGPGYGYSGMLWVDIQVYAYRTVMPDNVKIYSHVGGQSAMVVSNDLFGVNWSWDAVTNAEGYRVLRSVADAGYWEGVDVTTNTFADMNDYGLWVAGTEVTPAGIQRGASVQWNPTIGNTNNITGQWGCLESINFVIADTSDTGPYDLYIDNIQNGPTVFQTFEDAVAGTQDYGFRVPSFSGTTSGAILTSPDVGAVSNGAADVGTKSFHIQFQWNNTNSTKWLRLTTSGVSPASNPYVNLDEPISFRLLLQPVGATPVPPPPPVLTIDSAAPAPVLDWTGAHRLQTSVEVSGTYTNIPAITLAPYTNTFAEPARFFRLVD